MPSCFLRVADNLPKFGFRKMAIFSLCIGGQDRFVRRGLFRVRATLMAHANGPIDSRPLVQLLDARRQKNPSAMSCGTRNGNCYCSAASRMAFNAGMSSTSGGSSLNVRI